VIETLSPAPYLPSMLVYSGPLSADAFAKYGPLYNTDPKTCVSSGPFILQEWTRDQQIVYVKNDAYKGTLDVPVTKVIVKLAQQNTHFTLFQAGEVDFMYRPAPAELKLAQQEIPDQLYSSVGDFRTFYLFFDVTKKPFDDLRVRQAFSHAIDRDAIESKILGPQGTPAYSFLAPGFPAANGDALKGIQNFDPEKAKQLLAEAGYPDGKGFPKLTLWLRNEIPLNQDVANACVSMLTDTLGIKIDVANKDLKTFTDALNAEPTQITFGFVSYGLDFLDPFNMLGVWLTSGVYSWSNPEYDKEVMAAAAFLGPKDERIKMFQEAERLLVSDVPAVFIYHETPGQLIQPWVRGQFITPDDNGITSMHWPGYTVMGTVPGELYITKDVPSNQG
jgi:peptide/nickel transport system substrate-binding protein/oligopeptide transport system substrate-binding protein